MGKEKRPFCYHQNFVLKGLAVPALVLYTCIKALKYIPGPGVRWAFTEPLVLWFIAVAQALWLLWKQSFHWLTMGKVKIEIYCYLITDILTKVLQKCSCHGNRNVKFSKKIFKNLLLWSHKENEAETLHWYLCYYSLHNLFFLLLLRMWFRCLGKVKVGLYFAD